MRNLHLLYSKHFSLNCEKIKFLTQNTNDVNLAYVVATYEDVLSKIYEINWKVFNCKFLFDPNENDTEQSSVIGIEYLYLNNELSVASGDGNVSVFNLNSNLLQNVSYCAGGINIMSWSPDQEVVVFITNENNIVLLSSTYDLIKEQSLYDRLPQEQEFITVGWGKKQTQFHGTEGKHAALTEQNKHVADSVGGDNNVKRNTSVVWRGDCEYFVVSFFTTCRQFKVYNKEGNLQYKSELVSGLESPIYWRPSGSWIAVPHVLPNKYTIGLFEKNGLRHREIVLPFNVTEESVTRLCWSSDSEVLAVATDNKLKNKSNIYLYIISNYHWYIKQTLEFDSKISVMQWDVAHSEGKTLHIILENCIYCCYRWYYAIDQNNCSEIVSVIDGNKILLTKFGKSIIPPPMCNVEETFKHNINKIEYLRYPEQDGDNGNKYLIIDSKNVINLYEEKISDEIHLIHKQLLTFDKSMIINKFIDTIPLSIQHLIWLTHNQLIIIFSSLNNIIFINLCNIINNEIQLQDEIKFNYKSITKIIDITNKKFLICFQSGEYNLIRIINGRFTNNINKIFNLNNFCENIKIYYNTNNNIDDDDETLLKIISLKNKENLYINNKIIDQNITSIQLIDNLLFYTTLDKLKFYQIDLEKLIDERRMETGGKLITILKNDGRTILQMPRGNLETIQPRILSILTIKKLLNNLKYKYVFDILRKQRINLNLIVDHNPMEFVKNIKIFLMDILDEDPQWLCLFITDLLNDDVTVTMYSNYYLDNNGKQNYPNDQWLDNKLNILCELICNCLTHDSQFIYQRVILPIITTYVKRNNLEKALEIIWNIKMDKNNNINSDNLFKYLLYLVNVNDLYNIALGMYDFDLIIFVAHKTQKDPKEYLQFLNELKHMEEHYKCFKIDQYLKRYERALEHLLKCPDECDRLNETIQFIVKHNLYTKALCLLNRQEKPNYYNEITLNYAHSLRTRGKFNDACMMYERSGNIEQAILSAKHILDWQKCKYLAIKIGTPEPDIGQLLLSMVPSLQDNNRHKEAANLVIVYLSDVKKAIEILMQGELFSDAVYEARSHNFELLDTIIKPYIENFCEKLIQSLESTREQYLGYKCRLLNIRQEKLNAKNNNLNDEIDLENNDAIDECDIFSDTSSFNSSKFSSSFGGSTNSRNTTRTHRSSKNRRKHERKLLNLKIGNPFEDIALIDTLYNMTVVTYSKQNHIKDICKCTLDLEFDKLGQLLQKTFAELLNSIKLSLDEIWIPEMIVGQEHQTLENIAENTNLKLLQEQQHYSLIKMHQRFKPQLTPIDWEFEVLK